MFGVCKKFIAKLTDYLFTIIDLGTASFGNESSFTQQKENATLIKHSGPICIDFDEYPPYSGRISEFFEIYINENIKCVHGYEYSSGRQKICTFTNEECWRIMKTCFPDAKQIKKIQKLFYAKNVHMFKKI